MPRSPGPRSENLDFYNAATPQVRGDAVALKLGSSGEIVYQPPMSSPRGIATVSIILIAAIILAFVLALICGVPTDLITAIATVVLACGMLLLAFVAIFSDTVRGWLYKPILEVSMKPEPPECVAVQ